MADSLKATQVRVVPDLGNRLHYERLLYIRKHYGATRTEELKVQSIGCTEAA
jgi:hypothetical protein